MCGFIQWGLPWDQRLAGGGERNMIEIRNSQEKSESTNGLGQIRPYRPPKLNRQAIKCKSQDGGNGCQTAQYGIPRCHADHG